MKRGSRVTSSYGLAELLPSEFDAASTSRPQTPLDTPAIEGTDSSAIRRLTLRVTLISDTIL